MDTPDFSLLLPFYGRDDPDFLERAFRSSVHDQELPPTEVVLVQDGAVETSLREVAERLVADSPVPARLLVLPTNVGLAVALERGLEACRFEIVARMDADDVSLPARFARQLPLLAAGADLVGAGMYEFRNDVGTIVGRRVPPTGDAIPRSARFHDPFNHPTVVYRKPAVARAGGYRDMGLMEDYWLFARMIHSGARVENVPDPLLLYRISGGAYERRGGVNQFRAELRLQRELRRIRFTTTSQWLRNVVVRGGYRFVPVAVRRRAYRSWFGRRPTPTRSTTLDGVRNDKRAETDDDC